MRVGVGSFDPRFHVKEPTVDLAERLRRDAVRYQGNWIPHKLRAATEDGVFFAGDSAGHCLPLTAEGIRTALYFGIALGRELREVVEGRTTRETALRRYGAFSDEHEWKFRWMLRAQRAVPRVPPRVLALASRAMATRSVHALVVRPLPRRRAAELRHGAAPRGRTRAAACGCGLSRDLRVKPAQVGER